MPTKRKRKTMKGGVHNVKGMTIKGRTSTGRMPSTKTHPKKGVARFADVKKRKKRAGGAAMTGTEYRASKGSFK